MKCAKLEKVEYCVVKNMKNAVQTIFFINYLNQGETSFHYKFYVFVLMDMWIENI